MLTHFARFAVDGLLSSSLNQLGTATEQSPALDLARSNRMTAFRALRRLNLVGLVNAGMCAPHAHAIRLYPVGAQREATLLAMFERLRALKPRKQQEFCRAVESTIGSADILKSFGEVVAPEGQLIDGIFAADFTRPHAGGRQQPDPRSAPDLRVGTRDRTCDAEQVLRSTGSRSVVDAGVGNGDLRSRSLSSASGCAAEDLGSSGSVGSSERGGEGMGNKNVERLLGTVPRLTRASKVINPEGKNRRPPRKRKTVIIRAQDLRQWEHWRSVQPLMDRIYGPDWVAFLDGSAPPTESTQHADASELVAGIDPAASNPDAIKTIEVLMKGHHDLLKQRISPTEVPALLLKAWIGYAHLFNKGYGGPGDQNIVPHLRLAFRRLCAKQCRLTRTDILQRMAGFAFFMDGVRRNRKVQYYPKQSWVDIYGMNATKYTTTWQDALTTDPKIKNPLDYMLNLVPFVKPTDDEGNPIQPPEPTPAEKLAAIKKRLAERIPISRNSYMWGPEEWDKLPELQRMDYAIGLKDYNEMKRLEKELAGDPPVQPVP
jgi:hypothetical protein